MLIARISIASAAAVLAAALIAATPALAVASKQCPPNCQSPGPVPVLVPVGKTGPLKPIGSTGPTNPPPPLRKWASPPRECKSQDGSKSGWVSVGDGGNRCEYDLAKPGNNPVKAQ